MKFGKLGDDNGSIPDQDGSLLPDIAQDFTPFPEAGLFPAIPHGVVEPGVQVVRAGDAALDGGKTEIAFIDTSVKGWQTLAADVRAGVEVVGVSGSQGLEKIAYFLQHQSNVDAVHIFSHGSSGSLTFGSEDLTNSDIASFQGTLSKIGASLKAGGDLLLYGCDVGAGSAGEALVDHVAALTKANVAASTDLTGASALGGDWNLELHVGTIDVSTAINAISGANFQSVLGSGVYAFTDASFYVYASGTPTVSTTYQDLTLTETDNSTAGQDIPNLYAADSSIGLDAFGDGPFDTEKLDIRKTSGATFNPDSIDVVVGNGTADEGLTANGTSPDGNGSNGYTITINAYDSGGHLLGTTTKHIADTQSQAFDFTTFDLSSVSGFSNVYDLQITGESQIFVKNLLMDQTTNHAPVANADSASVVESATASATSTNGVLSNDTDADSDTLTVSAVKNAANASGTVGSALAGTYGTLTLYSDGHYSYTADNTSAINGAATGSHPMDVFTYTADDGHGGTSSSTLTFTIDRPAVAVTDPITTNESSTVTASTRGTGLLGNDSDPDTGNNTGLSVIAVNGLAGNVGNQITFADGSFITVNADGTYTYDPNHAWDFLPAAASGAPSTGTETFTYEITGGGFVTDTITINGQDSSDTLQGTAGADTYDGGIDDDQFKMQDGGNDNVSGGAGDDRFYFGSSLTAADVINGGTGTDTLILGGDYTGGNALVLSATTLTSVEEIDLHAGFSYNITTNDANVGAGATLVISAAVLGAGDSLTFDGSAETDGHFNISLGAGNDTVTGGALSDTFSLGRGGTDVAHGGGGNDTFLLGGALTAADTIDGGTGSDTVTLNGDYTGGAALVLGADTLTSVEQIRFAPGDNYDITTNDGNIAAGAGMAVNGSALGAGDTLTFDGSAETDGAFTFKDGAGNDTLTGGALRDVFDMSGGGRDTVHGGGGNDVFNFGANLNAGDVIDGGSGADTLTLSGDYSGGVTTNSDTLQSIEKLVVEAGHSYNLILNGLNVASGAALSVDASGLTNGSDTLTFDGSAVGAGSVLHLTGGAGADTLIGGNGADKISGGDGNDSITGGNGRDILTGGAGDDTFVYAAPSESTSTNHDSITDLDFSADHIHLAGYFVNAIDTAVTTGTASASNFDHHMQISVGAAQLGAHDAVLFTADHGTYAGHTYLVIDLNGTAGYQAGSDLVIDITGATNTGSFTTSTFT
jgi:VCBS repeat-containing protein